MSKVIDDALKHFRAKAARYRTLLEKAEAEIARLEELKAREQPNTVLQSDGGDAPEKIELTEQEFQALARWWG